MKIGIRDGCLKLAAVEAAGLAGQLGFDGLEVCIGPEEAANVLWQAGGFDRLNAACEAAGVVVASLSPGRYAQLHPVVDDPALRAAGRRLLLDCIERCRPVGADAILVPLFPQDLETWADATWQALIDGFKPLAAAAGEAGVTLLLETTFSADHLARILDGVDHPALQVYYDTANTTNRGYHAPTEIRQLGRRVGRVHVKDTNGQMLGDGRVPWADCRTALRDIRYDGWLVLETPAGDDAALAAARNYGFTRGWLP
ncbi:MAG: TIM barrel protein [Fimbriimonadaceae bacterium]|nr:TIM barrel protein [Fimbriimonadaceae bacterium]